MNKVDLTEKSPLFQPDFYFLSFQHISVLPHRSMAFIPYGGGNRQISEHLLDGLVLECDTAAVAVGEVIRIVQNEVCIISST